LQGSLFPGQQWRVVKYKGNEESVSFVEVLVIVRCAHNKNTHALQR